MNDINYEEMVISIIKAIGATVSDPSPANIIADLELAVKLLFQLKNIISNTHEDIKEPIKKLIKDYL